MAKFATNASGAMLLLYLIQVTGSISGSVVALAMFYEDFPKKGQKRTVPEGSGHSLQTSRIFHIVAKSGVLAIKNVLSNTTQ